MLGAVITGIHEGFIGVWIFPEDCILGKMSAFLSEDGVQLTSAEELPSSFFFRSSRALIQSNPLFFKAAMIMLFGESSSAVTQT